MLWQDRAGKLHLTRKLKEDATPLTEAVWAVGSPLFMVSKGRPNNWALDNPHPVTGRTVIGADLDQRLLFFIVFERADYVAIIEAMDQWGISSALLLDGGGSTTMTFGPHETDAPQGTALGGKRPVAGYLGVRTTESR